MNSLKFEHMIGFCRKPLQTEHALKVKNLREVYHFFRKESVLGQAVKSL